MITQADTVFQLREITPDDMVKDRDTSLAVFECEDGGLFDRYIVRSERSEHEVIRLGYMARCSCKGFEFGRKACKHILATLPVKCIVCLEREPFAEGQQKCLDCFQATEGFLYRRAA